MPQIPTGTPVQSYRPLPEPVRPQPLPEAPMPMPQSMPMPTRDMPLASDGAVVNRMTNQILTDKPVTR